MQVQAQSTGATPILEQAVAMPLYVDHARLVVSDLPMMAAWYQKALGLTPMDSAASGQTLGVDGRPLLTLVTDGAAVRAPRNAPGLFHTAFVVPGRADLGRWLAHVAHNNIALTGASDHLVTEAIYLDDPEGNGIEVYHDRPRALWPKEANGDLKMGTLALDLQALYDEAPKDGFHGMEPGTAIGHIHLQVSDIPEADRFFRDVLGLDLMVRYPGASFFATGQYHHHIAANIWNSRGQPKRSARMTGLADYSVQFNDPARLQTALARLEALEIPVARDGTSISLTDPWGIGLKLSA